uniref:Protein kinase domain-containing protein n=1 Tax=Rhizophagus irregularis (strain DAOM 181602 / DAOM 197198 / MUCL 43194) TaxID=747089 RepID=U9SZ62_RHIID
MSSQDIECSKHSRYLKNEFINWTSGNERIDDFIQEMQLKVENTIFEWIPYSQFNEIKETGKNNFMTIYSAIWKNDPLHYNNWGDEYMSNSNKVVALKILHNLQNPVEFVINEVKKYSTKNESFLILYGISQNPYTKDYILVQNNSINLTNWISGNEKIDHFIQEMQLEIEDHHDIIFEWIPYSQFNEIKETGKNNFITVYSAIWKNGPLHYNNWKDDYTRDSNKEVALKILHNLQNPIEFVINEVKRYSTKNESFLMLYGISQSPDTDDYILVQNNSINLTNWTSGNEQIDDFIQERQLKINKQNDVVFEWIPYSQFNEINKIGKNSFMTVYSAIWKDGPLRYVGDYTRDSNKEVVLKLLHNSQNSVEFIINEAKKYSTKNESFHILYGISQCTDTKDCILVQNNSITLTNWISGNEKIDVFIQEMQLEIKDHHDVAFEWIPYSQFNEIKETDKNSSITVNSAIWKNGPLYWNIRHEEYIRDPNKEVALKCLHNSQNPESLVSEVKKCLTKTFDLEILKIYGISQNPDTKDYILVQKNFIWTSRNEKVDNFIQEMKLKINNYNDVVVEWIPFNQFKNIKEIGYGGFSTVYSAEWKVGPLEYDVNNKIYKRDPNRVIALKCLHNSQNITNEFLNEVKEYSIAKGSNILNIHGISQNPDTKDYIMVLKYANVGSFNNWINVYFEYFDWKNKLFTLLNIINGLKEIHQKQKVHGDFHTGNILFSNDSSVVYISDMGLCKEVSNADKTNIYGVMPYIAPEVLRGKPYTQAADIYSFGMIMYFVATGRQPFSDRAHDKLLALDICNGIRPKLNELEAPKCYVELMKRCWDSVPDNRPDAIEVENIIYSYYFSLNDEIKKQFKEAEEYRKINISSIEINQSTTHPQASNISRLLNPFTKDLPKCDNDSECLDCSIAD